MITKELSKVINDLEYAVENEDWDSIENTIEYLTDLYYTLSDTGRFIDPEEID